MLVEMHCHTAEFSPCSHVPAVELVRRIFRSGFQGLVLTDHNYCWTGQQIARLRADAGIPEIFHIWSGQEYKTADYGDILIFGPRETVADTGLTLARLRKTYPDAALIWAHPYRFTMHPEKKRLLSPHLDGIEVLNSNYSVSSAAKAIKDWHELKFTAIAGTDTHAPSYAGLYPTLFDHPFDSMAGLAAELKAGRCRPYVKEIPRSGTTDVQVTEITMAPGISQSNQEMILKKYKNMDSWKKGERSHHVMAEICRRGFDKGKYRVPRPLDKDRYSLFLVEERISGQSLFDALVSAEKNKKREYLQLAAGWLANLHGLRLKITPAGEFLAIEPDRLDYYVGILHRQNHPHRDRVQEIRDQVWKFEQRINRQQADYLVQGHGDFHLKNIYIGRELHSREEYVAAIDFDSSFQLLPSFDVGTFLAQYRNMFFDNQDVMEKAPASIFLEYYLDRFRPLAPDFPAQVELAKARTYLSILYYLAKVDLGGTENFWTIMLEAEKSVNQVMLAVENR